jgi:hypothetical protein
MKIILIYKAIRIIPVWYLRLLLAFFITAHCECFLFSNFQNARTLEQGEFDLSAEAIGVYPSATEQPISGYGSGLRIGYGILQKFTLSTHYYYFWIQPWDYIQYHYLSVEPKMGIVPDLLAITIPMGVCFGRFTGAAESFQIAPTLIATIPVSKTMEINGSLKAIVFPDSWDNILVATLGTGLSNDLSRWALRPEVSIGFNPETAKTIFAIGAGLSISSPLFIKKRKPNGD